MCDDYDIVLKYHNPSNRLCCLPQSHASLTRFLMNGKWLNEILFTFSSDWWKDSINWTNWSMFAPILMMHKNFIFSWLNAFSNILINCSYQPFITASVLQESQVASRVEHTAHYHMLPHGYCTCPASPTPWPHANKWWCILNVCAMLPLISMGLWMTKECDWVE